MDRVGYSHAQEVDRLEVAMPRKWTDLKWPHSGHGQAVIAGPRKWAVGSGHTQEVDGQADEMARSVAPPTVPLPQCSRYGTARRCFW